MQNLLLLLSLLSITTIGCSQPSDPRPLTMEAKIVEHHAMQSTGTEILATGSLWVTSAIYDARGNNVMAANPDYVGIAAYTPENTYEFFNLDHLPRGDYGQYYITDNGLRVLYSESLGYFRVVPITELTSEHFTYKITNSHGQDIWVEHTPLP
jgi:Domain of unknown function (DUF4822)